MSEILGLDHVSIAESGPTLSMGIERGQWVGLFGPGGSGKSRLLRVLAGEEVPLQGTVELRGETAVAATVPALRRSRPLGLARRGRGPHVASIATEALIATRLWDQRNQLVAQLSPAQVAACELLGPLTSGASLLVLDGQLDRLDPWTLQGVIGYLRKLQAQGVALIAATNRASLASEFDAILVLADRQVRYAGPPEDLLRNSTPHVLTVSAEDQPGVKALVGPFSVSMRVEGKSVRLEAAEGQDLAARLLLEGYGNVRCVVHRPPTLEEALLALIR